MVFISIYMGLSVEIYTFSCYYNNAYKNTLGTENIYESSRNMYYYE